jgi:hypothetical protein
VLGLDVHELTVEELAVLTRFRADEHRRPWTLMRRPAARLRPVSREDVSAVEVSSR